MGRTTEAAQFFEEQMAGKDPSLGYYHLASILTRKDKGTKLVITTNFDSLTEDAIVRYTDVHPLVLGHENMAAYLDANPSRPIIAKVHRDLFFNPMNREDEMERLKEGWEAPLKQIFREYIPIFVGYAGGDQTLMGLLSSMGKLRHPPFWCELEGAEADGIKNGTNDNNKKIRSFIVQNDGFLVKIAGFDELFWWLGGKMGLPDPSDKIQERSDRWKETYKEKEKDFEKKYGPTSGSASISKEEKKQPLTASQIDIAVAVADKEKPEAGENPKAFELYKQARKARALNEYEEALRYIDEAIKLDSERAKYHRIRGLALDGLWRHKEALASFDKAIKLDPKDDSTYGDMAGVFWAVGEYSKALEYCEKALAIQEKVLGREHPDTAATYNSMAVVYDSMDDYDKALEYYIKALAIQEKVLGREHPDTAATYNSMAVVYDRMGEYDKALEYYKEALVIKKKVLGPEHPDVAKTYRNMAVVYQDMGDYDKAQEYSEKALAVFEKKLGPKHPYTQNIKKRLESLSHLSSLK